MSILAGVSSKRDDGEKVADLELIRRFKKGDENAFSSIVLKYQERLLRTAQTILGNEEEAKDISQETFVKAYFNLKKFRGDSNLYTWLYRILYNLCISSLRRKKIIPFLSLAENDDSKYFVSKLPDPIQETERREFHAAVTEALNSLPVRQRTVFVMKQIDGLKHNEIANIMGITEGAVKASYFHAVRKLRNLLSQYGENHGM
jgi:RNA polymerase sigma-70 factor, ECF subfamily